MIGMLVATAVGCVAREASSPDADDGCRIDGECFYVRSCQQGLVHEVDTGAVPCDAWHGPDTCYDHGTFMCTQGCTIESQVEWPLDPRIAMPDGAIFCAETPVAALGGPCNHDCLPTRAEVAADGTVTQQYLECADDSSGGYVCAAAPPPVVDGYLAPCPMTAAHYGGPGVNGVFSAYDDGFDLVHECLLAWDAASGTIANGETIPCIGDWECPDSSLCDDRLALQTPPLAVCRPGGPRGAPLDPGRL
jgi:hypothetical protein